MFGRIFKIPSISLGNLGSNLCKVLVGPNGLCASTAATKKAACIEFVLGIERIFKESSVGKQHVLNARQGAPTMLVYRALASRDTALSSPIDEIGFMRKTGSFLPHVGFLADDYSSKEEQQRYYQELAKIFQNLKHLSELKHNHVFHNKNTSPLTSVTTSSLEAVSYVMTTANSTWNFSHVGSIIVAEIKCEYVLPTEKGDQIDEGELLVIPGKNSILRIGYVYDPFGTPDWLPSLPNI